MDLARAQETMLVSLHELHRHVDQAAESRIAEST
jgi:hypothetical protein